MVYFIGIIIGILTIYLYLKLKYKYIITNIDYCHGIIHFDKTVRYNKFAKRFEYLIYYNNKKHLQENNIDIKKYDNKLFLNTETVEKYIIAKNQMKNI